MKLQIVFKAPSRAIQARSTDTNFGCAIGVGTAPSFYNNIASASPDCERNADGSWKCTANFALQKISFPDEFNNFIITAYDVAGNRVERHINSIQFKERRPALKTIEGASIQEFRVEMRRYPHSLKIFNTQQQSELRPRSISPHNGESTSYEVLLWFQIKDLASQDLPIRGFDIYRRVQGQSAWTLVGRKQYAADYTGEQDSRYSTYMGFHNGYDTDPSLEEGVTYEYKVEPFTDGTHRLASPTATARLLPASTIELINPADNGVVKKSELDKLSFSFRITNPAIWDNRLADSFMFGLLVTDKTSSENVIFAGKISVYLKRSAGRRLGLQYAVSGNPKEYSFAELQERGYIPADATEDDFISYSNGIVTIKPRYLTTAGFNHPLFRDAAFKTGYTYSWDILDWGKDAKEILDGFLEKISGGNRLLAGGYIFMSDIIGDPSLMNKLARVVATVYKNKEVDAVVTVATKGIPVAYAIASILNKPVIIIRRDNKVTEGTTVAINYVSGSTKKIETMILSKRSLNTGSKVLLVDDFMRGGGVLTGMESLMNEFDVDVVGKVIITQCFDSSREHEDDYLYLSKIENIDEFNGTFDVKLGNVIEKLRQVEKEDVENE